MDTIEIYNQKECSWGEVSPSLRPGRASLQTIILEMRDRSSATPSWVAPKQGDLQERNFGCGGTEKES
jgi:hypothetical protein